VDESEQKEVERKRWKEAEAQGGQVEVELFVELGIEF